MPCCLKLGVFIEMKRLSSVLWWISIAFFAIMVLGIIMYVILDIGAAIFIDKFNIVDSTSCILKAIYACFGISIVSFLLSLLCQKK